MTKEDVGALVREHPELGEPHVGASPEMPDEVVYEWWAQNGDRLSIWLPIETESCEEPGMWVYTYADKHGHLRQDAGYELDDEFYAALRLFSPARKRSEA